MGQLHIITRYLQVCVYGQGNGNFAILQRQGSNPTRSDYSTAKALLHSVVAIDLADGPRIVAVAGGVSDLVIVLTVDAAELRVDVPDDGGNPDGRRERIIGLTRRGGKRPYSSHQSM